MWDIVRVGQWHEIMVLSELGARLIAKGSVVAIRAFWVLYI